MSWWNPISWGKKKSKPKVEFEPETSPSGYEVIRGGQGYSVYKPKPTDVVVKKIYYGGGGGGGSYNPKTQVYTSPTGQKQSIPKSQIPTNAKIIKPTQSNTIQNQMSKVQANQMQGKWRNYLTGTGIKSNAVVGLPKQNYPYVNLGYKTGIGMSISNLFSGKSNWMEPLEHTGKQKREQVAYYKYNRGTIVGNINKVNTPTTKVTWGDVQNQRTERAITGEKVYSVQGLYKQSGKENVNTALDIGAGALGIVAPEIPIVYFTAKGAVKASKGRKKDILIAEGKGKNIYVPQYASYKPSKETREAGWDFGFAGITGFGLVGKSARAVDIARMENINQKSWIVSPESKEVVKTSRGSGFKVTLKKVHPEARVESHLTYPVINTKSGTSVIPHGKGVTNFKVFSFEKQKWLKTSENFNFFAKANPIKSTLNQQVKLGNGKSIFIKNTLKGWDTEIGQGGIIRGKTMQRFSFWGASKSQGKYYKVVGGIPTKARLYSSGKRTGIFKIHAKGFIKKFNPKFSLGNVEPSSSGKLALKRFRQVQASSGSIAQSSQVSLSKNMLSSVKFNKVIPLVRSSQVLKFHTNVKTISPQVLGSQTLKKVEARSKQVVIGGSALVKHKTKPKPITKSIVKPASVQIPKSIPVTKSITKSLLKPKPASTGFSGIGGFKPSLTPTGFVPPVIPAPRLKLFEARKKTKHKLKRPKTKYTPSLTALSLGIKAPKIQTAYKIGAGGLGLRPIIVKRKKRRKKVKGGHRRK